MNIAKLGRSPEAQRNLACYTIKAWALGKGLSKQEVKSDEINPELIIQAASGNLAKFVKLRTNDERHAQISLAHSAKMMAAINENIQALEANCTAQVMAQNTSQKRNKDSKMGQSY